jgi:hypothetical protein
MSHGGRFVDFPIGYPGYLAPELIRLSRADTMEFLPKVMMISMLFAIVLMLYKV